MMLGVWKRVVGGEEESLYVYGSVSCQQLLCRFEGRLKVDETIT